MRVLAYHGVVDRSEREHHLGFLFTDVDDFEAQARLLARRARPVGLDELTEGLHRGRGLPANAVHVTFDDGYRNNLRAAEILDRYRIPWSLYVVVDAVLDGYRPWYLRLADAVEATSNVMRGDGSVWSLSTAAAKRTFSRWAKTRVMASPRAEHDAVVDDLLQLPGMRPSSDQCFPILGIADVKELHTRGVAIGNHSARHRNLSRCPATELEDEVVTSRARLEAALGAPVRHFAYPDGRHGRAARDAVARTHDVGFATWTARRAAAPHAVRRYEPVDVTDLAAILDRPEPWYGARWARWNLPARVRERTGVVSTGR